MPRLSSFFLILIFAALVAVAQQQPAPPPAASQADPVFSADARLVQLHATVLDAKGKLITNLPKSAFTVLENGKPQPLKQFVREDVPVSLGLIIDNSGSMRDKRMKVVQAALALVKASHKQDEVFIVNFNDEAYLDRSFTSDIAKMEEALTKVDSRGGTAMRDAVSMSIDYLKEKGKREKKVLLVVTDGDDNTSGAANTMEKLVDKAQQSEVLIYTIGLLTEEERGKAKRATRALNALAVASGGLAYFPKAVDDTEALAAQVAHEIRNQYTITYVPIEAALDGTYRRIQVTAKGPGSRLTVRTRSGYYATPEQPKPKSTRPAAASSLK